MKEKKMYYRITGPHALRIAERDGVTLHHGSSILVEPSGWSNGKNEIPGYNVSDYFRSDGTYLGPDQDGIEPTWADAEIQDETAPLARGEQ
jgi:hypothetical protein